MYNDAMLQIITFLSSDFFSTTSQNFTYLPEYTDFTELLNLLLKMKD